MISIYVAGFATSMILCGGGFYVMSKKVGHNSDYCIALALLCMISFVGLASILSLRHWGMM